MEQKYLRFMINKKSFAVNLEQIRQVYLMVDILPLPNSPKSILGFINVQGTITPVVNLASLLGFRLKKISISDKLIILNSPNLPLAIVVNEIRDIIPAHQENSVPVEQLISHNKLFERVITQNDELILCINTKNLLGYAEKQKIKQEVRKEYEQIQKQVTAYQS